MEIFILGAIIIAAIATVDVGCNSKTKSTRKNIDKVEDII